MADLKQAMMWLAEGKKIRRKSDLLGFYIYLRYGTIYDASDCRCNDLLNNFDDWEIYEENTVEPQDYIVNFVSMDEDYETHILSTNPLTIGLNKKDVP